MKRLVLYAVILVLVCAIPVKQADVAQLHPIEVLAVCKHGGTVILAADTEDIGMGNTVEEALSDMRRTAPAVIYLDTAQYLLIEDGAEGEAEQLRDALKGTTMICKVSGKVDLKEAAQYLPVHGELPQIRTWQPGDKLPVLRQENDRLKFLKKQEKDA